MVEVFKTNVRDIAESKRIIGELLMHFPDKRINFDLSDCDRILRIEGMDIPVETIIQILFSGGYYCEVLV